MIMTNIISGVIQTSIIIWIIKEVIWKKYFSYNYLFLLIYYFIFTIPLMLDSIIGIPEYYEYSQYIYNIASEDLKVNLWFNMINLIIFFTFIKKRKVFKVNFNTTNKNLLIRIFLLAIGFLPIIIFFINYNKIPSFKYGYFIGNYANNFELKSIYSLFLNTTMIAVPAMMLYIILTRERHIYITFLVYFSVLFSIYLNGKRLIVFIFIILVLVNIYIKKNKYFLIIVISSIITMVVFNNFYSNYLKKEYNLNKFSVNNYLQYRIDYGRDHNVKMALYKEINNSEDMILEYRTQSFLSNVLFFIPREKWPNKPYPYGVYLTATSLNEIKRPLGWQMTTSIVDESIANLGVVGGIFFMILIFNFIFNVGYKYKDNILLFVMTNFIIILLLTMQFSFSKWFIISWILIVILNKFNKKIKFHNLIRLRSSMR